MNSIPDDQDDGIPQMMSNSSFRARRTRQRSRVAVSRLPRGQSLITPFRANFRSAENLFGIQFGTTERR